VSQGHCLRNPRKENLSQKYKSNIHKSYNYTIFNIKVSIRIKNKNERWSQNMHVSALNQHATSKQKTRKKANKQNLLIKNQLHIACQIQKAKWQSLPSIEIFITHIPWQINHMTRQTTTNAIMHINACRWINLGGKLFFFKEGGKISNSPLPSFFLNKLIVFIFLVTIL
jgi:hypothetical protein